MINENQYKKVVERLNDQIERQNRELDDLERAFRLVVNTVEEEKNVIRQQVSSHLENKIVPMLKELRQDDENFDLKVSDIEFQLRQMLEGYAHNIFLIHNRLTSKEIEICQYLVQGHKGKDIAALFGISYLTLRTHTKNIRKKLNLSRGQNLAQHLLEMMR